MKMRLPFGCEGEGGGGGGLKIIDLCKITGRPIISKRSGRNAAPQHDWS